MYSLNYLPPQDSSGDIRLVGGEDQQEAGLVEGTQGFRHSWQDLQLLERRRRIPLAVLHPRPIDDTVPIKKNRPVHKRYAFAVFAVPSHLASTICNFGCETKQCQTTDWNASVCGVTWSGSTVGITTTASPTCFV